MFIGSASATYLDQLRNVFPMEAVLLPWILHVGKLWKVMNMLPCSGLHTICYLWHTLMLFERNHYFLHGYHTYTEHASIQYTSLTSHKHHVDEGGRRTACKTNGIHSAQIELCSQGYKYVTVMPVWAIPINKSLYKNCWELLACYLSLDTTPSAHQSVCHTLCLVWVHTSSSQVHLLGVQGVGGYFRI